MSFLSFMLFNFGCSLNRKKTARPTAELSSVSISQNHMDRSDSYYFWARQENGTYMLDASCMIVDYDNNDYTEIDFTDKTITEEDFKQFAEIDSKYDFYSHLETKKEKSNVFVCDETITSFCVNYGEESFSIEPKGEYFSAVKDSFYELAKKYAE